MRGTLCDACALVLLLRCLCGSCVMLLCVLPNLCSTVVCVFFCCHIAAMLPFYNSVWFHICALLQCALLCLRPARVLCCIFALAHGFYIRRCCAWSWIYPATIFASCHFKHPTACIALSLRADSTLLMRQSETHEDCTCFGVSAIISVRKVPSSPPALITYVTKMVYWLPVTQLSLANRIT